jgi:TonB family protein
LGIYAAIVVHAAVFAIIFPSFDMEVRESQSPRPRVYKVQQVRFQPPKPEQRPAVPERRARRIPIPDPTPDDPEPFFDDSVELPDPELPVADVPVSIPTGPPATGVAAMQIAGEVVAPERLEAPRPNYTEEARAARIQGVVILQTIINIAGKVTEIKVLKGLPSGLTEEAIKAVESWSFRPATLHGEAVPVYYIVTVSFNMQ